jgi:hypothetical protein
VRLDHITPKAFYEKSQDEENIPSKHDNDTRCDDFEQRTDIPLETVFDVPPNGGNPESKVMAELKRTAVTRKRGLDNTAAFQTSLLDDHRALDPPDPIPNSEVKRCLADGSVGSPHVRVGHRQASK